MHRAFSMPRWIGYSSLVLALVLHVGMQSVSAQGNGNMPALLLSGQDAKNVANYIAAVAGH